MKSDYLCPLCKKPLTITPGSVIHKNDGVTLYCDTPLGTGPDQCPAQEVMGHGRNEDNAYDVITQKYKN